MKGSNDKNNADANASTTTTTKPLSHPPLPRNNRAYGSLEYWQDRFATEESFDWLLTYEQLAPQLKRLLPPATQEQPPRLLIVGCGNAPFSAALYQGGGYHRISNVDYSDTVIANMQRQYPADEYPGMSWHVADMTDVQSLEPLLQNQGPDDDHLFDAVIDKAAMDALMVNEGDVWYPHADTVQQARDMCHAVSRVLKDNGLFLQISLTQPHFRKKYLLGQWELVPQNSEPDEDANAAEPKAVVEEKPASTMPVDGIDVEYSDDFQWTFQSEPAGRPEDVAGSFGHYLYILKKRPKT